MTTFAKVGGILGGGVLISSLIVSSATENKGNTALNVSVVPEQAKTIQKPVEGNFGPKKGTVDIDQKPSNTIPKPTTQPSSNCHSGYSGCLKMNAGDYDCAGGSGNGPNYTGSVRVYGSDPFDLDRDNDGWGCE